MTFLRLGKLAIGLIPSAFLILSIPSSAQILRTGTCDPVVTCDPAATSQSPEICIHTPVVQGSVVNAKLSLNCPDGSEIQGAELNGIPLPDPALSPSFMWSVVVGRNVVCPIFLPNIEVSGICTKKNGKELSIRRDFCLDCSSDASNAGPQPVVWTDPGPDGIEEFSFVFAVSRSNGLFGSKINPQVQFRYQLKHGASLALTLTHAEESTAPPPQRIDHFLVDLSYSVDLWESNRIETSVFFGPGWDFTSGTSLGPDREGLTAHLGLGLEVDLSDRFFLSLSPRARWYEARKSDELYTEIAFGVGVRFGGR